MHVPRHTCEINETMAALILVYYFKQRKVLLYLCQDVKMGVKCDVIFILCCYLYLYGLKEGGQGVKGQASRPIYLVHPKLSDDTENDIQPDPIVVLKARATRRISESYNG